MGTNRLSSHTHSCVHEDRDRPHPAGIAHLSHLSGANTDNVSVGTDDTCLILGVPQVADYCLQDYLHRLLDTTPPIRFSNSAGLPWDTTSPIS
jgi:hypothetical protein